MWWPKDQLWQHCEGEAITTSDKDRHTHTQKKERKIRRQKARRDWVTMVSNLPTIDVGWCSLAQVEVPWAFFYVRSVGQHNPSSSYMNYLRDYLTKNETEGQTVAIISTRTFHLKPGSNLLVQHPPQV